MPKNQEMNRIYLMDSSPNPKWAKVSSLKLPDDLLCRTPQDLIDLLSCSPKDANQVFSFVKRNHEAVHHFLVAKGIDEKFIDFSLHRGAFVKKLSKAPCPPRINNTEIANSAVHSSKRLTRLRFDEVVCHDFDELRQYLEKEGHNPNYRSLIAGNLNNIRLFLEAVGKVQLAASLPDAIEGMSDSDIVSSVLRSFGFGGADNTEYEYRNYIDILQPPVISSRKDGEVNVRFTYKVKSVINDSLPCRIIDSKTGRIWAKRIIRLLQPGEYSFVCSFPFEPSDLSFETRLGLAERIIVDINGPIEENKIIKFYVQTHIESLFVTKDSEGGKSGYCYCIYDDQRRLYRRTQAENGLFQSVYSFGKKSAVALAKSLDGLSLWISSKGKVLDNCFIFDKVFKFEEDGLAIVKVSDRWAIVNSQGFVRQFISYDQIKPDHNSGVFIVRNKDDSRWGLYNYHDRNMLVPCKHRDICFYQEGVFGYKFWGVYYFRNVLAARDSKGYNRVTSLHEGYGVFDAIKSSPSWGFVNRDFVEFPQLFYGAGHFSQGWAPVWNNHAWGYISKESLEGNLPIDPGIYQFEDVGYFQEDFAIVKKSGKWGYVHIKDVQSLSHGGKLTGLGIPCQFENAAYFTNGYAAVLFHGKWGFIDTTGSFVVDPVFDECSYVIVTDKKQSLNPFFTARKGDKWSIYYLNGQEVPGIPVQYEEIGQFAHGLAPAKLNGKWGFINPEGYPIGIDEEPKP